MLLIKGVLQPFESPLLKLNFRMTNYFNLYSNCVITRGKVNSLIVDYKSEVYFTIPNFIHDVINELCQSDLNDILLAYKDEPEIADRVEKLKDWLVTNNLGIMATKPKIFSPMRNNFEFSSLSNAIIEIENLEKVNSIVITRILNELIQLQCKAVQIILVTPHEISTISDFLKIFYNIVFQSVELVVKFKNTPSTEVIENLIKQNLFLKRVYIFGCESQNIIQLKRFDAMAVFSSQEDYSTKRCGSICQDYFSTNLMTYFEAKKHNSCLNQKVAIDRNGNIKNCLSLSATFGNVCDSSISQALKLDGFKKYWDITKDEIDGCKTCEFRYVCTDCRAFLEDPKDIFSKPLKCGYDPNTGEWSSWEINPMKKKAIEFYGF